MKDYILSVDSLSYTYENQSIPALRNVSLQFSSAQWVTIIGANGSGKSTLAKLLIGLLPVKEGAIVLENIGELTNKTVQQFRQQIGMVFQNPDNQFVATTVWDDVAFGMENRGIPYDEMLERAEEALSEVGMMEYKHSEPHTLSGGQKQRVAIAGILALQPKVIIFDESSSMLDIKGRNELLQLVKTLVEDKGVTVISITHDLEEVQQSQRVIAMDKGKIIYDGVPRDLFSQSMFSLLHSHELPPQIDLVYKLQDKGILQEYKYENDEGLVEALCKLI